MKMRNAWLLVGFIAVADVFMLTVPGMLLSYGLHWWAEDVMHAHIDTPGFSMIFFCLGATTTALCYRPWDKYWVQRLTEGPRKRALKTIKNSKD